jgi:organic radical activating enzyme
MDDVNTNKQFRIYDSTKKFIRLSVDETIARKLNKWQGWQCSAGVRALYIDFDGNIWICNTASSKLDRFNFDGWRTILKQHKPENPTDSWWPIQNELGIEYRKTKEAFRKVLVTTSENKSKYPGFLGNIFDSYDLPTEWYNCPWESCGCGADIILSKAKSQDDIKLLSVTNHDWHGRDQTRDNLVDTIQSPTAVEMNFSIPYQILWDLGRRCNYDCSYCWTSVHNRTDDHKDFNLLVSTANNIIDRWSNGHSIRWNFGGGEPTLHPKFLDFIKHLKTKDQWIMITTNGTRDYKYWEETAKYVNSINLSAHFDGLKDEKDEDRFVRNVEVICQHFDEHNDDHWLEIKLMAPPQYIDRALKLRDKITALGTLDKPGANNRIKGVLSLVPIRSIGDSSALVQYTDEQLELFKNQ